MKSWGIAATLGFAFIAFVFGQAVGVGAVTAAMGADLSRSALDGAVVAVSVLVGTPVQVITLVLAARMTGEDLQAYLGLDVPRRANVAIAVAALAVLIVVANLVTLAFGRELVPPFQLDIHRSALAEGAVLPLWIAIIIAAPVGEELLFRGFLFRGLVYGPRDGEMAQARKVVEVFGQPENQAKGVVQPEYVYRPRDALPGILAISLIWSLLHIQYDWFATALVFAIGVFLGYVRLWSGSTTLVILLHMLLNLESVAETVFVLGWV